MQQPDAKDLAPRLRAAADAVRPGAVAADVGTDHGYLVCHLVASGKCPSGFASDLRPQPLASARRHIREQGLEDRIQALLSDGLQMLPGDRIDDVIIAGMGGELIGQILTAVDWTRDPDKRYVLQPMTRAAGLRVFLYRHGFRLLDEAAVADRGFLYTVMTAAYTGRAEEISQPFAQCGLLLDKGDEMSQAYRKMACDRLKQQADGMLLSSGGKETAKEVFALIDAIKAHPTAGESPME